MEEGDERMDGMEGGRDRKETGMGRRKVWEGERYGTEKGMGRKEWG